MAAQASARPSPEPLGVLRGHGTPVNSVCALDATRLVSGGADGLVKLWNLKTRRESQSVAAHSRAGVLHTTRLNEACMLTHGRDGTVKVWDVGTFGTQAQPLHTWFCGSYTFTKAATMRWEQEDSNADASSSLVVCPSAEENDILVYDSRIDGSKPAMMIRVPTTEKKRGMCTSLSLFMASNSAPTSDSADGAYHSYIAAGWEDGHLSILDLRSGGKPAMETSVAKTAHPLLAFDMTPDGRTAICGSAAEELSIATLDFTALCIDSRPFFTCNHGGISAIRIRPDQRIFATAGWDHRIRIFHLRKLKPLAVLKYHRESVFGVDFTPDSHTLVSASKDNTLAMWSIYPPTQ